MTQAMFWMAIEALIAALVAFVLIRLLVARIKRSARTFTIRDAEGQSKARFILGDEEDFTSVMVREVTRLEKEHTARSSSK